MTTTFTPNKNLSLPGTGDDVGTWGTVLNANFTAIDLNVGGTLALALTSSSVTLSQTQAENLAYALTGTLTANVQLIFPAVGGFYVVNNQTSGAFQVTAITAAVGSTGVAVPQGLRSLVYSDGTNVYLADDRNLATTAVVPNGRLTLVSQTPVMITTTAGAATVYYTPYVGNQVPVWSGSTFASTAFSELSQALSDATKSPAAALANSLYDLFVWSDAGTLRCTRGPAWTSLTGRGTGAGTTQLTRASGVLVNTVAITNGPAAGFGTYVGTVLTDSATATVSWKVGSSASGGGFARFGVFNAYNRVPVATGIQDSTTSWTYTTATFRAANNSGGNSVTYVDGLGELFVRAQYNVYQGNTATPTVSIGVDSTTSPGIMSAAGGTGVASQLVCTYAGSPGLGSHFLQALEKGNTGVTFFGSGDQILDAQLSGM